MKVVINTNVVMSAVFFGGATSRSTRCSALHECKNPEPVLQQ